MAAEDRSAATEVTRARRRPRLRWRRARRRSSGVVPPHIPCISPDRIAKSRHSWRTRQPAQIRCAFAISLAATTPVATGKKRSGSADRQAPSARHSVPYSLI